MFHNVYLLSTIVATTLLAFHIQHNQNQTTVPFDERTTNERPPLSRLLAEDPTLTKAQYLTANAPILNNVHTVISLAATASFIVYVAPASFSSCMISMCLFRIAVWSGDVPCLSLLRSIPFMVRSCWITSTCY